MENQLDKLLKQLDESQIKVSKNNDAIESVYTEIANLYMQEHQIKDLVFKVSKTGKLQIQNNTYSIESIDLNKWVESKLGENNE